MELAYCPLTKVFLSGLQYLFVSSLFFCLFSVACLLFAARLFLSPFPLSLVTGLAAREQ